MIPTVEAVWRYPVKSLRGERVESSRVTVRGLLGDRLWAVQDSSSGKLGSGKDTRRFERFPGTPLLAFAARFPVEPDDGGIAAPIVVGPDGVEHPVAGGAADALLQRHSGIPTLNVVRESDVDHFDEGPVSLLGSATLDWVSDRLPQTAVDARRFRPNLVVRTATPFAEEAWCGRRVRIGTGPAGVELAVDHVLERCAMVNSAQADLPYSPAVLKLVGSRADQPVRLAVLAWVVKPGAVRVGDTVLPVDS